MDASRLPPVTFAEPRLGREVERYLREATMSGAFRPGERLGLDFLAETLGVSTMPVREALISLANEGLVEQQANRGFRVAQVSRADVEDLFRVHAMVAGLLAERAARVITEAELDELRRIQRELDALANKRMSGARRAAEAEALNWQFHRIINQADAESNRLRWFIRIATRYVPRSFYATVGGWLEATLDDHPALLDALAAGDTQESRRLMELHTRHATSKIVEYLEETGFWRHSPAESSD